MIETAKQIKEAREEWDYHMGGSRKRLRTWQVLGIGLTGVALWLFVWAEGHVKPQAYVPVVVDVAPAHTSSTAKGRAEGMLPLTRAEAKHFLFRFITDLFTVSTDPVSLKTELTDAYTIATGKAIALMTAYIAISKPLEAAQRGVHVRVVFRSFLPRTPSMHAWTVRWRQQTWAGGQLVSTVGMEGRFDLVVKPPKTESQAENDPFGLFVETFTMKRDAA